MLSKTLIFTILVFLLGLYFVSMYDSKTIKESMSNQESCPDVLVQKDAKIYLFNSRKAEIPGVNPIEFRNLEEYVEFTEWQKSQGIKCPVLFLQKTYDPQGNGVYRIRPSPTDPHGGIPPVQMNEKVTKLLDASRDDPPYNTNSNPGFDPKMQRIGMNTPLDKLHNKGLINSSNPNAMDPNWKPNSK